MSVNPSASCTIRVTLKRGFQLRATHEMRLFPYSRSYTCARDKLVARMTLGERAQTLVHSLIHPGTESEGVAAE